jgi:hypothetical protein
MTDEQTFQDSLRSFNTNRGSESISSKISSYFSRHPTSGSTSSQNDEAPFQSLLGNVRSGAENMMSSFGYGNRSQEEELCGLTTFQVPKLKLLQE